MSSDERRVVVPGPRPVAVREIQLIDRVEEMRILREVADRAINGQGSVVFIHGEAGIGKTRMARELGAYARSRGMQVLSGRCPALFKMNGVPPYVLWEEVVKDYLEVCTPEQLLRVIGSYPIEISKLVPELKHKLRVFPQSFPLSPEHRRDRLFEAVSQFITNISKETPLLVVLDDLQWTDESSLLMLHYLARGVYRESLLLLGAYRDTYINKKHPLTPVLAELNRERLLQSVRLKRLSFADAIEMIKQILEQEEVSEEFCRLVYEKTRGNPFFVEEVMKSLKEEKIIYREDRKWRIKEVPKIEFPDTIKDVIRSRINRLDDESQRVLTLASFIGKDFDFEALCGVTDIEKNQLLEIMDKLLKAGFIEHKVIHGEDICSFADIIVRDVVHEEVGPFKRKRIHGVVGTALEKVYAGNIDKHLGELALHFLESGDRNNALVYFLRAGEKAANVYANSEAASYFQSALRILKEKDGESRQIAHVLEKLGDIKKLVGEHDACMDYWNEALLLWKQLNEKEKTSRLHRKMAQVFWDEIGDTEKAKEHHEKAMKILEADPESVELASIHEDIARMLWRTGDVAEALPHAERALELARKLSAFEVISNSYTDLALVLNSTGETRKAVRCLERALKIALDNGHMESAIRAYNNLSVTLPGEENERRLDCLEKGFELAKKVGHITFQSWIGTNLAWSYIGMGNLEKALLLAEESLVLDKKADSVTHLSMPLGTLGLIFQIMGRWDESEQYLTEALGISRGLNEFQSIAGCHGLLGWLNFDKGEYVKAKENFEKQLEVLEKAGAKNEQMGASRWAILAYIELGELEKARNLIDNLNEFALQVGNREFIGIANALRAGLFRAQKKWRKSIQHFEESLQCYEALGARRWNAYVFVKLILNEYARMYLERDRKGDREEALKLLNQALEIYEKMGAKKDIERTKSKMILAEAGRQEVEPQPLAEVVLPERITTGYADLDDLLSGGISRDYAVILTSPSCDERNLLVEQFLEAGAREGQVTFHLTVDASGVKTLVQDFQSNFYLFICNPEADTIIQSMPNVYKLKGVENLTDVDIALASALRRLSKSPKGPRRACIEIVSDVLLQHHAVSTRRWLTALIPKLKAGGFTTLAVMNPQMHSPQEAQAILGLFDGEMNIYEKETEKGEEKFLKIKKMTNQKYSKRELSLQEERLKK